MPEAGAIHFINGATWLILVDEDQPFRIDTPLMALPPVAAALHIGAFTLVGNHCLFLKLNPQLRRNRQTVSWLTAIPRESVRSSV